MISTILQEKLKEIKTQAYNALREITLNALKKEDPDNNGGLIELKKSFVVGDPDEQFPITLEEIYVDHTNNLSVHLYHMGDVIDIIHGDSLSLDETLLLLKEMEDGNFVVD